MKRNGFLILSVIAGLLITACSITPEKDPLETSTETAVEGPEVFDISEIDWVSLSQDEYLNLVEEALEYKQNKTARDILLKCYRLYPNEVTAQKVDDFTLELDSKSEYAPVMEAFTQKATAIASAEIVSSSECAEYILSDEFKSLQVEDGALTANYQLNDSKVITLATDKRQTLLTVTEGSTTTSFLYNELGCSLSIETDNGNSSKELKAYKFSTDGTVTQTINATLANNYCVGDVTLVAEGVTLTGNFDDNGHTTLEQKKTGELVILKDGNGKYISIPNATAEEFRLTKDYLELP